MQNRRVSLLRGACQSFVDFGLAADQSRMYEAPIEDTRALGGWAQQPDHQNSLNFIVKGEPEREEIEKRVLRLRNVNEVLTANILKAVLQLFSRN